MSTVNITTVDENDLVAAVSRNWWVLLFIGLVSLAVGIWAVVAPEKAFGTLSLIFAVWLLVTGI